jgi:hypothetical protein
MEEEKMERQVEKLPRTDVVIATLYSYHEFGKKEISLSEILESIQKLQDKVPLKYSFSKRFLYSVDLLEDLADLKYKGYIRSYKYRHDLFLPKNFIKLTPLGIGKAKKIKEQLPINFTKMLAQIVSDSIKNYEERWRLWSRSLLL